MLKMLSVLTIGFDMETVMSINNENFLIAVHTPDKPEGMTDREYYYLCRKFATEADVVFINLDKDYLSVDEVVLLHLSYTKSTPILAVGDKLFNPILNEMITHRFISLQELYDHVMVNYVMN